MAPYGSGHSSSMSTATTGTDSETWRPDSSQEPSYTSSQSSSPFRYAVTDGDTGDSWDDITLRDLASSPNEPSTRRDSPVKPLRLNRGVDEKDFAYDKAQVGAILEKSGPSSDGRSSPIECGIDSQHESKASITSIVDARESLRKSNVGAFDPNRPFTSSLSTSDLPTKFDCGGPPKLSIISDAGDQQQLRQQHNLASTLGTSACESKNDGRRDSIQENEARYELQSEIFDALVQTRNTENYTPDAGFLPKAQLYSLVNEESVARELEKDPHLFHIPSEIRRYAHEVCRKRWVKHAGKKKIKTFRKIFALLVLVEAASSISLFLESDVSDLDLPLASVRHGGKILLRRRDSAGHPAHEALQCFQHRIWSPFKIWNFERMQWSMLAPYFSPDKNGEVNHYLLRDQHILPFVASQEADDDDAEYHGGYGKVFMVRIHDEQHNFSDKMLCQRGFAVKQLHKNDRESFKREVTILKMFSGERSHKHVVSLLATYEQFNKFHFIFYRAEGDLFKYWKELRKSPAFTYHNILWIAEQWAGIAEGLSKLHKHLTWTIRRLDTDEDGAQKSTGEKHVGFAVQPPRKERTDSNGVREQCPSPTYTSNQPRSSWARRPDQPHSAEVIRVPVEQYGRHGDINPGNILWYDDSAVDETELRGTLKISDFGQAELNSLLSRTRQRSVANTMTYRPPECDLQPKTIRQSYDIWCLGCVYLEFVAWVLGGEALLLDFVKKRCTRDIFLNNQITDTFFQVVKLPESDHPQVMVKKQVTLFINELHKHPNCTEYFHEILNLVQFNMLLVESKDRMPCEEVRKLLADMYAKCRDNEEYATKKSPWRESRIKPKHAPVKVEMTEDAEKQINKNLRSLPERPRKQHKPKGG